MPSRYFSEEITWAICKWNWIAGAFQKRMFHLMQLTKDSRVDISSCSRNFANILVFTHLRGVLQMNILIGLYSILGLHFWSRNYTSSCHSMQVFVLNYMVIFLLFKSRNRNLPPRHVFTISPAFTFVMFLIIVSLENVCGKFYFLFCTDTIKWNSSEKVWKLNCG